MFLITDKDIINTDYITKITYDTDNLKIWFHFVDGSSSYKSFYELEDLSEYLENLIKNTNQ